MTDQIPINININIITSSQAKFLDCQAAFQTLNSQARGIQYQVSQVKPSCEILEIQSMDVLTVARHKMVTYLNQSPNTAPNTSPDTLLIMEDSSMELFELGGFPGPYIKDFYKTIGGSRGLAKRYAGTRAIIKSGIIVSQFGLIIGEYITDVHGTIASEPRGSGSYGYADVFIPDSGGPDGKTLAELDTKTRLKYQPDTVGYMHINQWLNP